MITLEEIRALADERGLPDDGLWSGHGDYFWIDGTPLKMREWAVATEQLKKTKEAHVARTHLGRRAWVSTVWIGIDYSFGGGWPPLFFETMVFLAERRPRASYEHWDHLCRRWSSLEEARAGHQAVVEGLRRAFPSPVERRAERRRLHRVLRAQSRSSRRSSPAATPMKT